MSDYAPYEPESVLSELDTFAGGVSPEAEGKTAAARAALDHAARDQGRTYHNLVDDFTLAAKERDMYPAAPEGTVVPDPALTAAQKMAAEISDQNPVDGVRTGILATLGRNKS